MTQKRIIIAISGASGAIYGIRILELLKKFSNIETHLIISKSASLTINSETNYQIKNLQSICNFYYNNNDIAAKIASGSFKTYGMIIAPCSVKTMAQIANGSTDNLITRAADVILKEKRKLLLMVRESPLHLGHLRNMANLAEIGAIIAPPVPEFYTKPETIEDIILQTISRALNMFDIEVENIKVWQGL